MSTDRLEEFRQEVDRLKVRGGAAEPERRLVVVGVVLAVAGLAVAVIAYAGSNGAQTSPAGTQDQLEFLALAVLGLVVTIAGAAIWLRHSFTRYFRYWLVRLVYEDREQTDRLVTVLERLEARLAADDRLPR
jgi:hypothetical protein